MTERRRSEPRWRRYATEVLAIVIGILLALAADAGRQYLADRATEREILAALREEFSADVQEIRADQDARALKLSSIELLSEVRSGAVASPPPDSLSAAMFRLMDWRFYTARHPVLDDVLSTGRIDLIRSDDLRRALMVFEQERARIAVIEERDRGFVARQIEPYLAAHLDLDVLSSPGTSEQRALALRAVSALLAEREMGSLLYMTRERTVSSSGFADRLLGTVTAVQKALDGQ